MLFYRKDSLSSAVPEGMEYIEPITESDDTLEIQQVTYPLLRFIIHCDIFKFVDLLLVVL